ncbi:MAG: ankyrin repeat domain-containing protein [Alphaproteobacteria bacterium]|nr:ankyrin repeat domain-containing protein [Alphaproteobacteria bacterium]
MLLPQRVFDDAALISVANAARNRDISRLQNLVASGIDLRGVGREGLTVTHFALYAGPDTPAVLDILLKAGADPISQLTSGTTVPELAAKRDNADPKVITVLLTNGLSPNWRAASGISKETSLIGFAIQGNNLEVVRTLVDSGADINYVNPISGSALHDALEIADFEIAAYLVDAGIDLSLKSHTSPLIEPGSRRMETAIERFCRTQGGRRGRNPSQRAKVGWALLMEALAKRGVSMPCGL